MTNIYKGSDERGALMLEAIALLGLMTMMSPMVVRQTADRTAEMEEVAIAGQMKTLRDAVSSYIDSNYANIAAWANDVQVLTLDDLRPYLPASFIQADGTLGNKLVDDYRVGIRRERPCNDTNPDGSLTDACNRWKITGLISSGTQAGGAGNELDDRRAARIATMIGADGGYIRSTQALNALFPGNAAEANKAIGAQGIWEIDDVTQFFPAGGWQPGQGRVVATTTYTSGIGGDFLYRHAVNSLPEANSMFTDIDMSGMGTGAHRIRHSGGLEVVNGKIIVRDSRDNNWDSEAATTISNTELTMQDADVSITKNGNTTFTLQEGEIRAATAGGEMGVTDLDAYMAAGGAEVSLSSGRLTETASSFTQDISGSSDIYAGGTYTAESGGNMNLLSSATVSVSGLTGANVLAGSSKLGLSVASAEKSSDGFSNTASRIVGGLTVKDDRIVLLDSGNVARMKNYASGNYTYFELYGKDNSSTQREDFYVRAGGDTGGMMYLRSKGKNKVLLIANDSNNTGVSFMRFHGKDAQNNRDMVEIGASEHGYIQLGHGRGGDSDWSSYTVGMTGTYGEIYGSHMFPRRIALKASPQNGDDYGNPVRSTVRGSFSDTGVPNSMTPSSLHSETLTNQLADTTGHASKLYGGNTISEKVGGKSVSYSRYEVDPAFVSVMNDIKLTSRGGAHLADILPNYINKGIYVLSNTYGSGPWPCDSSTCNFVVPRLEKTDGGAITTGAWENDCDTMKNYLKGGASCSDVGSYGMRVNYYASSYTSCGSGACLTHPYLGIVPAPGHQVSDGVETISGKDEGPCPDGYLPVMTVTPTAIEVGKVNHIDMRVSTGGTEDDSYVYYNLENIDFSANRASIYQPATAVSTAVLTLNSSGNEAGANDEIYGWKVALGTISTTSDGYVWNQGGVWQDSMKAVAHTYCYFNPSRFNFPNMVVDDGMLKAMPAPRKTN